MPGRARRGAIFEIAEPRRCIRNLYPTMVQTFICNLIIQKTETQPVSSLKDCQRQQFGC
jgi:hypothetical protein